MLLRMSWRNMFRNKRRTILNLVAISVNITVIIFFIGYMRYLTEDSYTRIPKYVTAHIQIHAADPETGEADPQTMIRGAEQIHQALDGIPGILYHSDRMPLNLFILQGNDRYPLSGFAIEPEKESRFGVIESSLQEGAYLSRSDQGVLIGTKLADMFGLGVGDTVTLAIRAPDGTQQTAELNVQGIFETRYAIIDKSAVYLTIAHVRELLGLQGETPEIRIALEDRRNVDSVIGQLEARLPKEVLDGIRIDPWTEYAKGTIQNHKRDIAFLSVFLGILLLVGIFGMTTTTSMNVLERKKEIGTLRAIGMDKGQVGRLFLSEGLLIGVIGALLGCVLGGIVTYYIGQTGIPIPASDTRAMPVADRLYTDSQPLEYLLAIGLGLLAGLLGTFVSIRRVNALTVVNALKED